jgi:fructose-1-phosphate kinase PfkB-like protein
MVKYQMFYTIFMKNSCSPGGIGIEVSAHILYLQLQVGLGPLGGSLEGHVLQEVGHAIVGRCLIPKTEEMSFITYC